MKRTAIIAALALALAGPLEAQQIGPGHVMGNSSASGARPTDSVLSAILDRAFGSTQGSVLYRGASAWSLLTPGSSGQFLQSQGAAANPIWGNAANSIGGISGVINLLYGLIGSGSTLGIDGRAFPNWIGGCALSVTGTSSAITISPCATVANDASAVLMQANSYSKNLDPWVVGGAGQGCLDTGSMVVSQWYALYEIMRTDTNVVDYLCTKETAPTAPSPTLPTNYGKQRYVGSFLTTSTSVITKFSQQGDTFFYDQPFMDVNAANPGTSAVERPLTVPQGIPVEVIIDVDEQNGAGQHALLVSNPSATDITPTTTNMTLLASSVATQNHFGTQIRLFTNSSGRIRTRNSASGTSDITTIITRGYHDISRHGGN